MKVIEYAKYLGVDPLREPQLLRIAQVSSAHLGSQREVTVYAGGAGGSPSRRVVGGSSLRL